MHSHTGKSVQKVPEDLPSTLIDAALIAAKVIERLAYLLPRLGMYLSVKIGRESGSRWLLPLPTPAGAVEAVSFRPQECQAAVGEEENEPLKRLHGDGVFLAWVYRWSI